MKKREGWLKSQITAITFISKFKEVEEKTKEKGGNGISGIANPVFIFSIAALVSSSIRSSPWGGLHGRFATSERLLDKNEEPD